ncbi:BglG family transcription antiterminator [Alkalithermobacter paradoxus]|uniref:PtsGHI operon antiterminator n=1 Tax=Alkalithermobacter paradoxus TaxID=29349 RepID=A0A1V4IA84_9FIRM|nr:PtsGHI operon antiterminator [[Clostridium] thermoalcaliphilum]
MKKYIIKKVLSNNVILVTCEDKEYILVGKGVGFGKKKDTILQNIENVENTFISLEGLDKEEYESLLSKVDKKIAAITEEIIAMISTSLQGYLNPNIHIGLIDHISFAIKRLQENIEIVNPFLLETKILYPKEYELAEKAVEMLRQKLDIKIPDAEIGFIALHIRGARSGYDKTTALKKTKLVNTVVKYVEETLNIHLKKEGFDYIRFITHLRGVIGRIENQKLLNNPMLDRIKEEFSSQYSISCNISNIIEKELNLKAPEDEIGYMALHIYKLKQS